MTPKQQMMTDYLDGKMTNVEIIEAWDRQREENKRYRKAIEKIRLLVSQKFWDRNELEKGIEKVLLEALEDEE